MTACPAPARPSHRKDAFTPNPARCLRQLAFATQLGSAAGPALAQDLTVYSSGDVPVAGSRQLTAYVPLAVNTVTWDVNGVAGGNSGWGTVNAKGLYAAPASVPAANAMLGAPPAPHNPPSRPRSR